MIAKVWRCGFGLIDRACLAESTVSQEVLKAADAPAPN
jgi:hypothetical protein